MRVGEPVHAELIYPVYDHDKLVLPSGTIVNGSILSLTADHRHRIHARLRVDFTPFHIPVVGFTSVVLPDGTTAPLVTGTATDGTAVYRLVAPPPAKGGFVAQQIDRLRQTARDRIRVVTGPDKKDRLTQFLYSQLPYHPERVAAGTSWTVETAAPLAVTGVAGAAPTAAPAPAPDAPTPTWMLQAYLADPISSETSKAGQAIRAIVAEPILNPDGSVAVPQGSVLTGAVTQARPARMLGRVGELRFSFRELSFPGQQAVAVQAALTGADGARDMAMNSEGEVKPKPKDKLIVPLILLSLAGRPLDGEGGQNDHLLGKDAVASNSLGSLGLIVGIAARQPYLAAGIGYYGAAISLYERIFARGKEVAFGRDTRVVIETTARRSAAIKPETAQNPDEPTSPRP